MIREQLMGLGSWALSLEPLPARILDRISRHDSIVITPTWMPGAEPERATLLGAARYRGVILEIDPAGTALAGQGPLWWLGDGSGIGAGGAYSGETARTFSQWLSKLSTDGNLNGLTVAAGISIPSTTWPDSGSDGALPYNARAAIDLLASALDCEYRISPAGVITPGGRGSAIFATTPTVLLSDRAPRGRSEELEILPISSLAPDSDSAGAINYARVEYGSAGGFGAASRTEFAKDAGGTDTLRRRISQASSEASTVLDADRVAEALVRSMGERDALRCAVDAPDPRALLEPGDLVAVSAPELGFEDAAEDQRMVGGEPIFPKTLRLIALEWPFEPGCGAYALPSDGTLPPIDITRWVRPDERAASLELGARGRTAFDP